MSWNKLSVWNMNPLPVAIAVIIISVNNLPPIFAQPNTNVYQLEDKTRSNRGSWTNFQHVSLSEGNRIVLTQETSSQQDRPERRMPLSFIQRASAKDDSPGNRQPVGKFGGSQCPSADFPLTALVPGVETTLSQRQGNNTPDRTILKANKAQTAQERPTFWFYVPYPSTAQLSGEFILIDDQNQLVHRGVYHLTGTPGIVAIPFPKSSDPLVLEKNYRWLFSIICDSQDRTLDIDVNGKVQRVEPSPEFIPPPTATLEERAALYARDGLWYEILTMLIQESHSVNLGTANFLLTELLESVGLSKINPVQIGGAVLDKNNQ